MIGRLSSAADRVDHVDALAVQDCHLGRARELRNHHHRLVCPGELLGDPGAMPSNPHMITGPVGVCAIGSAELTGAVAGPSRPDAAA